MEAVARIERIVGPSIEAMGYELVRVQISGGQRPTVQIMAERADGVAMTVEDCAEISRTVSALMDVEDPLPDAYTLEVSSPGIDRPLTRAKDFERFRGFEARIETKMPLDGRRRFKGLLQGVDGDAVRLALVEKPAAPVKPGRRKPAADPATADTVAIPLDLVLKAKLELTDELLKAAALEQGAAGTEGAEMEVGPESRPARSPRPAKEKSPKRRGPGRFARRADGGEAGPTDNGTDGSAGGGSAVGADE